MTDNKNTGDKPEELKNNSVIMSSVQPDDIQVEHDDAPQGGTIEVAAPRKQKNDPLAEIRAAQESAEAALAAERERRISAEHERDNARSQVENTRATLSKSESEKIAAQEQAIATRVETAVAEVENAERALEEAIDTGKPAREQIALQKRLSESVYKLEGAKSAKVHFDNWKEREKNKPAAKPAEQNDNMTPAARKWIDEHPRYNTDKKYRRTAIAAHEDALEDGVAADSSEYFRRINEALVEGGFEGNESAVVKKPVSATSVAAPAAHNSTEAGARGGNAAEEQRTGRRIFKLDGQMREMALKTYGKNSAFKLSDDEAYKRYAAKQLEIRDKRANGERL